MFHFITKQQAVRELPYIQDKKLFSAVTLSLWLYLEQQSSLKRAIRVAGNKYKVKQKVVERLVRLAIPSEVIDARTTVEMNPFIRELEDSAIDHLRNI
ncbi:hypothetical protein L0B53_19080 (plasmid) [Vibrio sp. SS-MA-C1-2]|uniref:hypothetical protein n=1 Tax=Vibrio sp. SS-MA-C1-2 TaxID=2908646 RepID=UPI001F43F5B2|nr:hypothetical protein [Vibrio sp. SS-MA-C1-2]UJF20241.1 hypothetical protein L0B53_19080 [Vibrio sp. SS-MA-C1-2]